jgi:hypothetical protein
VRHVTSQIRALAERHPGWLQYRYLAEGQLELLRGDMHAAKHVLELGLEICAPDLADPARSINAWPYVAGAYMRALVGLDHNEQARAFGELTLRQFSQLEISATEEVEQAMALAETRLCEYESATRRLDALIARQHGLGVVGLHLGASYETRARIAIWAHDVAAFTHFVDLAAHEYRFGRASGLSARCERLREEAQRAGLQRSQPGTSEPASSPELSDAELDRVAATNLVDCALDGTTTPQLRAAAALRLLCEMAGADSGHLYLVQPDSTLCWMASRAAPEPSAREKRRAARHFEWIRTREVGVTVVSTGRDARTRGAGATTSDPRVPAEQALLLTASNANEPRHVALVITIASQRPELLPREHEVLSLLGSRLWLVGDTAGVPAF